MTPAGMTFSTLAASPRRFADTGVMGVGKFYLISPKFISADGGSSGCMDVLGAQGNYGG